MREQRIEMVRNAVCFMEKHLGQRINLDLVAQSVHYSKYHLHRIFAETLGLTVHGYAKRRQLTEAARLLAGTGKPIVEIALCCGYESQQSFTGSFKTMYKTTPACFRKQKLFYALELPADVKGEPPGESFTPADIRPAVPADIPAWMELARRTVNGYPRLFEPDYKKILHEMMERHQALILMDKDTAAAALSWLPEPGKIEYFSVHPQYRNRGIGEMLLNKLSGEILSGREISVTTFRAGDKADPGHRNEYLRMGFKERELCEEYGYPVQRFSLPPAGKEKENERRLWKRQERGRGTP